MPSMIKPGSPDSPQQPPSPKNAHWALGHIPHLMDDLLGYLSKVQKECGGIAYLKAPVKAGRMYVLTDLKAIKHVLLDNNQNYTKGQFLDVAKPILGNGLVTSEGSFWRKQRQIIQPAFHHKKIEIMLHGMTACIDEMLREWEHHEEGQSIDFTQEMDTLALNIISRSLFKIDNKEILAILSNQFKLVLARMMGRFKNPVAYARWLPTRNNRRESQNIKLVNQAFEKTIQRRKKGIDPRQDDVLDMLLDIEDKDTGEKMSDSQLRDELATLVIGGYEAVASALTFMFFTLAEHPKIYQKVLEAVDMIDANDLISTVSQSNYLHQVVSETLRHYPPVFLFNRQAKEQDALGPFTIPAGGNISIPTYTIHHMAEYWENAQDFRPERFSPENAKKIPKLAYLPFGKGARLCIGEQFARSEMLLTLAKVSKKYRFELENNDSLELWPEMTLGTKKNIRLKRHTRNTSETHSEQSHDISIAGNRGDDSAIQVPPR